LRTRVVKSTEPSPKIRHSDTCFGRTRPRLAKKNGFKLEANLFHGGGKPPWDLWETHDDEQSNLGPRTKPVGGTSRTEKKWRKKEGPFYKDKTGN